MRRLVLAAVSLVGLSACGFTPLYGDAGVGGSLSRIAVTTQDDRLGYRVREQLEDALGRDGAQAPLWRLETVIDQERRPLGRRIDDTAARYELTVRGAWTLTLANGIEVALGRDQVEERFERFLTVYEGRLAVRADEVRRVDARYTNGVAVQWKNLDPASGAKS